MTKRASGGKRAADKRAAEKAARERAAASERAVDREKYEAIFAAFASGETNRRGIARITGVSAATVQKAWHVGWPGMGLPPISESLRIVRATGRALAELLPGAEDTPAGPVVGVDDAVRAALPATLYQVAEESRTLEFLRQMGLRLAQTASRMADAGDEVCETALAKLAEQVESGAISPLDALRVVNATANMGKTVVDLLGELMKMHRLVLGQPGEIIGHMAVATTEEALAILDRGTRQAERVRQLGLVSLSGEGGGGAS